jgi:cytoskeletal protein CcmA (bactofilin family)
MFGKNHPKKSPLQGGHEKFETIIGPQVVLEGHLRAKEGVRVDGKVVGDIVAEAEHPITVVIGPNGQITGHISAHFVVVAGHVVGNIHARERVELHTRSRVEGDIRYASIAIEHGATVLGLLLHANDAQSENFAAMTQQTLQKAAS